MPSIYQYESASHWLKAVYEEKCARNKRYSIRSFAKSLGVSYSVVARLFQDKTKLSPANLNLIADQLKLDTSEKTYFGRIADANVNTTDIDQMRIHAKEFRMQIDEVAQVLNLKAFSILQMIEVDSKVPFSVARAAEKLSITTLEVKSILEKLESANLIKIKKSARAIEKIIPTHERILIESKEAKDNLHRYYKAGLQLSSEALDTQSPEERYIGTETIAFDQRDLPQAQKIINEALDRLVALSQKAKNPDEVYHVSTQIFKITRTLAKEKSK